jgi:hypothetical protein
MGQASLQVFCVHLIFCFAGLTIMGPYAMLTDWRQAALLASTLSAMLATAMIFSKSEDQGQLLVLPSALEWNRALLPEEAHPWGMEPAGAPQGPSGLVRCHLA